MTSEKEIWKRIDRNHELSNLGRVRTLIDSTTYKAGSFLKMSKTNYGITKITALGNIPIHRLVAKYFMGYEDIENYIVNFKDGNKDNLHTSNLEVVKKKQRGNLYPYTSTKTGQVKWIARIKDRKENHYLGMFQTKEEAQKAIKNAREYICHRKRKSVEMQ